MSHEHNWVSKGEVAAATGIIVSAIGAGFAVEAINPSNPNVNYVKIVAKNPENKHRLNSLPEQIRQQVNQGLHTSELFQQYLKENDAKYNIYSNKELWHMGFDPNSIIPATINTSSSEGMKTRLLPIDDLVATETQPNEWLPEGTKIQLMGIMDVEFGNEVKLYGFYNTFITDTQGKHHSVVRFVEIQDLRDAHTPGRPYITLNDKH